MGFAAHFVQARLPPLLAPRKLALFSHYAQTNIHLELYVAFVLASSPSQTTPTRQHLGCLTWLPQSWWNVCLIVLQPLSYFCLPTTTLLGLGRLFLSTTIPQLYLSPPAGLVSKDGGGASLLHRLLENDVKKKMIKWMAVIHWTESVLQMMSIFFMVGNFLLPVGNLHLISVNVLFFVEIDVCLVLFVVLDPHSYLFLR